MQVVENKQTALIEAQKYANLLGRSVYVLRRGDIYNVSNLKPRGWKLAEIVQPEGK